MYFYRDILVRAWEFTKKNKYLWFFGLFAALITGNGGEIDIYFKSLSSLTERTSFLSPSYWISDTAANILERLNSLAQVNNTLDFIWLVIAGVATLLVIWFVVTSQTALIHATGRHLLKKKTNFGKAVQQSQKYFLNMLVLNILGKIIIYGGLLVLAIPWLAAYLQTEVSAWQIMYLIVSFIVLVPVAIIVSFLVKYSAGYIIIKGEHIIPAIGKAWSLFMRNWLVSLEMALTIFVLNLLVSFSVFFAVLMLTTPFLMITSLTGVLSQSFSELIFFIALAFLLLVIVIIFVGAIFSAFQWSAWTVLFIELNSGKARAKIIRWFKG